MAFSGTLQKCKVCDKTVYFMDQLTADGISYHKSCFKCNHCKGTQKLSNYSSMEGILYCKPHFDQLFKESGNFNKNFQLSAAKSAEKCTPELTRSPSKAAGMFSGNQEKCATCGKTAYPLEKLIRCPVCNLNSCEGTMQILDVRHAEQFLEDDYKNGSWEYTDIGSRRTEKPCNSVAGIIFDLKHLKSPCIAAQGLRSLRLLLQHQQSLRLLLQRLQSLRLLLQRL